MSSPADLEEFLKARQSQLTPHLAIGDVDGIASFYDPKLSFNSPAWNLVDLTKEEFAEYLRSSYVTSSSITMEVHSVHGTCKEFSVSEWTMIIVTDKPDRIRKLPADEEVVLKGCSLQWWKKRSGKTGDEVGDWRIVKENTYSTRPIGHEGIGT